MEISKKEARKLLSLIAKSIRLELLRIPRTHEIEERWCFAKGKARFTMHYFSLEKMLNQVLKYRNFIRVPGTFDPIIGSRDGFPNPFYGLSLDELKLKLKEKKMSEEVKKERQLMLTVKDLIAYLQKQNPDALILGWEMNSMAYTSQFKEIPNHQIQTVKEAKEDEKKYLENVYRNCNDKEERIKKDIKTFYRYSSDDDVIIQF